MSFFFERTQTEKLNELVFLGLVRINVDHSLLGMFANGFFSDSLRFGQGCFSSRQALFKGSMVSITLLITIC